MLYGFLFALLKPSRNYLRGFLMAALAGDKIAEFSFPEIAFHFPLRPWFFVSPAYAGKDAGKDFLRNAAGKSSRPCVPRPASWDHPRVCGEKSPMLSTVPRRRGSPPRMRGKVEGQRGHVGAHGITPAYAGKSWRPSCRCR